MPPRLIHRLRKPPICQDPVDHIRIEPAVDCLGYREHMAPGRVPDLTGRRFVAIEMAVYAEKDLEKRAVAVAPPQATDAAL